MPSRLRRLGRRRRASSSCTPPTTAGWCGSRCCWCATSRPPRRSCRTRSSRCTAAGGRCASRTRALAYLRQTVVNRSRSVLRHRGVRARHAERAGPGRTDLPGADEDALVSERRAAVLDAMRALPERQREVLALRYYLDLSEAEIAAHPRHQPRRREEPRLARRRRPAHPDGGRVMSDRRPNGPTTSIRDPARGRRLRRGAALRARRDPGPHRVARPRRRPWVWGTGGAVLAHGRGRRGRRVARRRPPARGAGPGRRRRGDRAGGRSLRPHEPRGALRALVPVYYVGDTGARPAAVPRVAPRTLGRRRWTSRVAATPSGGNAFDPDYRSAWPAGTHHGRAPSSRDGVLTVDLGGTGLTGPPRGMSRAAAGRWRSSSWCYTAQARSRTSRVPVTFVVDGSRRPRRCSASRHAAARGSRYRRRHARSGAGRLAPAERSVGRCQPVHRDRPRRGVRGQRAVGARSRATPWSSTGSPPAAGVLHAVAVLLHGHRAARRLHAGGARRGPVGRRGHRRRGRTPRTITVALTEQPATVSAVDRAHDNDRAHRSRQHRAGGRTARASTDGYDVVLSNSRGPETLTDAGRRPRPDGASADTAEGAADPAATSSW